MPQPLKMMTPGDREIVIERAFDANRDQVWRALTEPRLVRRWMLGPPGWAMPVCEIDLTVGGHMRVEWANGDGRTMGMTSVFREIAPPDRLVATELFDEDWTGGETVVTQSLHDEGAGTILRTHILYASQEARDGAKMSGMTTGMEAGYERLDAMFAEAA
jgi:uncharacterized protein YndB with AHSA1/START domain